MPVKRRASKRRVDPRAEVEAWETVFECEYDFFGDLEPWGFTSDEEKYAAAPDAWQRLGAMFLETYDNPDKPIPWALEAFGPPPGWQEGK